MSLSPAYHLRTNKHVERLLFVELLRKLDGRLPTPVAKYRYVSLGGPYLEDFALVHGTFGNRSMTSLEIKKHVRSRQRINQPHSRVDLNGLKPNSTADFVEEYQRGRTPLIVWFDYEWPDWTTQIAESCDLLRELPSMSVFKVTLSGKTKELVKGKVHDPLVAVAGRFNEMFGAFGTFSAGDVNSDHICKTLYRILRGAIAEAIPDSGSRCVRSLASYRYNDGTPILTVVMITGPIAKIEEVIFGAQLEKWPFSDLNWHGTKEINVPSLSWREKLAVDQLLPDASARTVLRKLKLQLTENYQDSIRAMENYVQFYRHVPQFLRVSV
jgi:hypothetical protein